MASTSIEADCFENKRCLLVYVLSYFSTYCFVEVGVVRGNVNVKVGVREDGCGIGT